MTTEQLVKARARAKVTHIYLDAGLVDEASGALARLIEDLGDGVAAEANGGGSEVEPTARPKAVKRPGRQAAAAKSRPRSKATPRSSVQGPTQKDGKRAKRSFTKDQQEDGAARARTIGVSAAARELDVQPSVLRSWMRKYPLAGSPLLDHGA